MAIVLEWIYREPYCDLYTESTIEHILQYGRYVLRISPAPPLDRKDSAVIIYPLLSNVSMFPEFSVILGPMRRSEGVYASRLQAQETIERRLVRYRAHKYLVNPILDKCDSSDDSPDLSDLKDLIIQTDDEI